MPVVEGVTELVEPGFSIGPNQFRYNLDETEMSKGMQALMDRVLLWAGAANQAPPRYALHEIPGTDQLSNVGRSTECRVFDEAFGNGPAIMESEYKPYEQASTFFIVHDTFEQDILGVIRIAREAPIGFKTLVDLADSSKARLQNEAAVAPSPAEAYRQHGIFPHKAIDVMTLAIPIEHRGIRSTDIMGSLYHQTIDYSNRHDIGHWLMMLDERAQGIISSIGVPLTAICGVGAIEYLGSEKTYPLLVKATDVAPEMQNKAAELQSAILQGEKKRATLRLNRGMLLGENFRGQLQKIIW